MDNQLIVNTVSLRDRVKLINSAEDLAMIWPIVKNMLRFVKDTDDLLKERGIEIMKEGGLREVELGESVKIILTKKKTDRFETDAIYKALAFTDEQVAVLPKNPSWRKTAILQNDKVCHTYYQDEKDDLELKELDMNMLKKLGKV